MSKTISIPSRLIIDDGAINSLLDPKFDKLIKGKKIAIISGSGHTKKLSNMILELIYEKTDNSHLVTCVDNQLDTIHRLENMLWELKPETIIAVGGGKVLDVCKMLGTRMNLPFILIPTTISSDAICSPVAVVRHKKNTSLGVKMPNAVIVDLDIIKSSPIRLIKSGYGDLLSNKSSLYDWILAERNNKDEVNEFAKLLADNAVESFVNVVENHYDDKYRILKTSAKSLAMSGIAMSIAESSRPSSGSEHLISHALDYHCGSKALHGEQVAIGSLITQYLQKQWNTKNDLRKSYSLLKLPTHYRQLGYSREDMHYAIKMAPTMRERYTIFDELKLTDKQIGYILDDVFDNEKNSVIYAVK